MARSGGLTRFRAPAQTPWSVRTMATHRPTAAGGDSSAGGLCGARVKKNLSHFCTEFPSLKPAFYAFVASLTFRGVQPRLAVLIALFLGCLVNHLEVPLPDDVRSKVLHNQVQHMRSHQ